jgi:hypothetical protein
MCQCSKPDSVSAIPLPVHAGSIEWTCKEWTPHQRAAWTQFWDRLFRTASPAPAAEPAGPPAPAAAEPGPETPKAPEDGSAEAPVNPQPSGNAAANSVFSMKGCPYDTAEDR